MINTFSENFTEFNDGLADALFISECLDDGSPGAYLNTNKAATLLLGYTSEEFKKLKPGDINRIVKEDDAAYHKINNQLSMHGKALYRTDLLSKNGQWVHVEVSCQKHIINSIPMFFCLARDISIREKYEETIKALVRSTVGLTGYECLDEIVKNLCSWLGADGACIGNFVGDHLYVQACFHKNVHSKPFKIPISCTPLRNVNAGEYVFYENGAEQFFNDNAYGPITKSNCFIAMPMTAHDGSALGAVCLFSDDSINKGEHIEEFLAIISSRAAAEWERLHFIKELSLSEEMLRILFNSTAEAIVGINLEGKIVFCNPSTLSILGHQSEDDLLGRQFYNISHGIPSSKGNECPYIDAIKNHRKVSDEDIFINSEGNLIPVECWGHPMHRDNKLVGAVITFINISRRKALEQQLQHAQKMEAIGTLTGGIAHDFNNILTVISGYVGLLESQLTEQPKVLRKIQKIGAAAERGSKLTNGLLAYSRKKSEPSTPVDLNQLVSKVHEIFIQIIGDHIEHSLTLDKEQMVVLADAAQIEQVLVNLATNARDAMPDGGYLKMITTHTFIDRTFCQIHGYGEPGQYALIKVEDSGVGIPAEIQQQIFDPFFTTKDTGKGTGLGLAMAWGIIKQHKGYIKVDSQKGNGSCFNIFLPLSKEKVPELPIETPEELPGGQETILLVEDDQLVMEATENILTSVGYKVHTRNTALLALEFLKDYHQDIHIILSDVVMPGLKGPEFYHELRKITVAPVIFMSGYTFDSLREQGLLNEGVPLLSKPVQPVDLLISIRSQLDDAQ